MVSGLLASCVLRRVSCVHCPVFSVLRSAFSFLCSEACEVAVCPNPGDPKQRQAGWIEPDDAEALASCNRPRSLLVEIDQQRPTANGDGENVALVGFGRRGFIVPRVALGT